MGQKTNILAGARERRAAYGSAIRRSVSLRIRFGNAIMDQKPERAVQRCFGDVAEEEDWARRCGLRTCLLSSAGATVRVLGTGQQSTMLQEVGFDLSLVRGSKDEVKVQGKEVRYCKVDRRTARCDVLYVGLQNVARGRTKAALVYDAIVDCFRAVSLNPKSKSEAKGRALVLAGRARGEGAD